jgi:hypothetical protein
MNKIEEKLWNYIDGNCTPDEQKAIISLIAADEAYRLKYQELLTLNKEFSAIELEEPPMAFTYNIMEAIRAEQAQKPLKAAVNKRIIRGIGIFFVFTLIALLIFTLSTVQWSALATSSGGSSAIKLPDLSHYITKPVLMGFFFFDVVSALFLFDTWLRKKKFSKQG